MRTCQFLLLPLLLGMLSCQVRTVGLDGEWGLRLGAATEEQDEAEGIPDSFPDHILLPGTTDCAGIGLPPERTDMTDRLSRRHRFIGKAWYRRPFTIPRDWKDRPVWLILERTKAAQVFVDGRPVSASNDICTPQHHALGQLMPGQHTLTVCVDNAGGVPPAVIRSSHMYSEDTQTNWNGILGFIGLSVQAPGDGRIPQNGLRKGRETRNRGPLPLLEIVDGQFSADGHPVFLRGRHDACVFPRTGHVPMDVKSWRNYFQTCREYGLNHVRFHSWCPPEAAFAAADEAGIYLQPELPFWGRMEGSDTELLDFLRKEGRNILRCYGHHPSFALFSLGNELSGDKTVMQALIDTLRRVAPHIHFTNGTNPFLGWQGWTEGTDFFATCRTAAEPYGEYDTHVRSSFAFCDAADGGILNHFHPGTTHNFADALPFSPVPVISHETGQFQSYPDFSEIEKYDGTPLIPCNLTEFRRRLEAAGLSDQARDFHRASGRWAALLYKADMEMCLRTPGLGGFQLLDLQDYPGQGSAYVGILDAFLDSKGFVTSDEWREACSEIVPLVEMEKYCWTADETFQARILLANFSGAACEGPLHCYLRREPYRSGCTAYVTQSLSCPEGEGLQEVGRVKIDIRDIIGDAEAYPARYTFVVESPGHFRNTWPVWIYPAEIPLDQDGILETSVLDGSALQALSEGASVLLTPLDTARSVGGLFQTDYWNYRMFKNICERSGKPVSPGTLGILTDPAHPLFRKFPTEEHSNWQWFPVLKASRPMILDALDGYKPLVQVIDNIERNHRLGLVFEFAVGKGRLLVCCADLDASDAYPEGRQFHAALLDYIHSAEFRPDTVLTPEQLQALFL